MFSIVQRITITSVLLLSAPVILWMSGWKWQFTDNLWCMRVLFGVTETVTKPWGIITHMVLCLWFLWCLRFHLRSTLILFIILSIAILSGQGIKLWLKSTVHEVRPFVIWLEEINHISTDKFYSLKYRDREIVVKEQLSIQGRVPNFLSKHWQKETSFSFPSGHALFANSWALLGVALLWPYQKKSTITFLIIWASAVTQSRMLLGMHWPQDLVVSSLISCLLVILAIWLLQKTEIIYLF